MRLSPKTRWIIALLFLAVGSQALAFAPGMRNIAAIAWGLSLAFLIGALVITEIRRREERSKSSR